MGIDFDVENIPLCLYPLGLIDAFVRLGADINELLHGTDLALSALQNDSSKITYVQQTQIIRNAIRVCATPGLGLLAGRQFDWAFLGTLGGIIDCSPSLADAYISFRRYLPLLQPMSKVFLVRPDFYLDVGNFIVCPVRTLSDDLVDADIARFELEFRLAILLRLYNACGCKSVSNSTITVGLNYSVPNYQEIFCQLPVGKLNFNCRYSYISVSKSYFRTPWRQLRKPLFDRLLGQCEAEYDRAGLGDNYGEKVRWLVCKNLPKDTLLDDVAEQLKISPRALTRRLAAEGKSFRRIVNDARMENVCLHIRSSRLSSEELADSLGFSCAASLRRALKVWNAQPKECHLSRAQKIGTNIAAGEAL